jgi:hypothetical protein
MAISIVADLKPTAPRSTPAAPTTPAPPRVYSPFPARRLLRPMAVRADAEGASASPGRTRFARFRPRRELVQRP